MNLRLSISTLFAVALLAAPAAAARAPATHARTVHAPAKSARVPTKTGAGPRRLEDVHIEGETPVPQVLFITTRDARRFEDFQHRRYLVTGLELGERTSLPRWVLVTTDRTDTRKETTR
jgi:hypothetical protein